MIKLNCKERYSLLGKIGSRKRWDAVHQKISLRDGWSKNKTAIHSYLSGDGYIKIRGFHYELNFAIDNLELAQRIVFLFKEEFNISPNIYYIKPKGKGINGFYSIRLGNKPVVLNLLSLGQYGSLTWDIPNHLQNNLLKEWVKCFFDCEAHVNKTNNQIQVKSVNYMGLNKIKDTLFKFNIESRVYGPYKQRGIAHNPYSMLIIYKKESVKRYNEIISFYHPSKSATLNSICRNL